MRTDGHDEANSRKEEKPTRYYCMLYCLYDTLNIFRALLCPSSGSLDYVYAIATYGVQCLAVGCRGSSTGQQAMRAGRGMLHFVQHPSCLAHSLARILASLPDFSFL